MCLYPRLIKNRKYTITKKNGGNVPKLHDPRLKYIAVGCGNCIECRKQKANSWRTRMMEELKTSKGKFVTLTFAPENLEKLTNEMNLNECNAVAGKATRRFLERWRKKNKKSVKHWLITEMGHKNTERIHLHGILFTDKEEEEIQELWNYGEIYIGDYCNEKTVNYIVKYVTKIDEQHKGFVGQIFCSPGIGKNYMGTLNQRNNEYRGKETNETYRLNNGQKVGLPIYYRNKIYTESQREELWLNRLDKEERYVSGIKIDTKTERGLNHYYQLLENEQKRNIRLGYGNDSDEWKKKDYNVTLRMLRKNRNVG